MKATVYYDSKKRIRGLIIVSTDGQDSFVLEKIATAVKDHSVPNIKVKNLGDIDA